MANFPLISENDILKTPLSSENPTGSAVFNYNGFSGVVGDVYFDIEGKTAGYELYVNNKQVFSHAPVINGGDDPYPKIRSNGIFNGVSVEKLTATRVRIKPGEIYFNSSTAGTVGQTIDILQQDVEIPAGSLTKEFFYLSIDTNNVASFSDVFEDANAGIKFYLCSIRMRNSTIFSIFDTRSVLLNNYISSANDLLRNIGLSYAGFNIVKDTANNRLKVTEGIIYGLSGKSPSKNTIGFRVNKQDNPVIKRMISTDTTMSQFNITSFADIRRVANADGSLGTIPTGNNTAVHLIMIDIDGNVVYYVTRKIVQSARASVTEFDIMQAFGSTILTPFAKQFACIVAVVLITAADTSFNDVKIIQYHNGLEPSVSYSTNYPTAFQGEPDSELKSTGTVYVLKPNNDMNVLSYKNTGNINYYFIYQDGKVVAKEFNATGTKIPTVERIMIGCSYLNINEFQINNTSTRINSSLLYNNSAHNFKESITNGTGSLNLRDVHYYISSRAAASNVAYTPRQNILPILYSRGYGPVYNQSTPSNTYLTQQVLTSIKNDLIAVKNEVVSKLSSLIDLKKIQLNMPVVPIKSISYDASNDVLDITGNIDASKLIININTVLHIGIDNINNNPDKSATIAFTLLTGILEKAFTSSRGATSVYYYYSNLFYSTLAEYSLA